MKVVSDKNTPRKHLALAALGSEAPLLPPGHQKGVERFLETAHHVRRASSPNRWENAHLPSHGLTANGEQCLDHMGRKTVLAQLLEPDGLNQ